ncbi:hypothetical protein VNI00_014208 [Paramarasmius palmivorus]|uniref:Integrase catalytic domain-containing protein n=1 Tax=Paramarasmius palmivorus TaxID=297713 RepID=A0AAW0BVP7_9AGAR
MASNNFPPLPPYPSTSDSETQAWSPLIYQAHHELNTLHISASQLLSQESDPLRLQIQKERLTAGLSTLYALAEGEEEEELPIDWLLESTVVLAKDLKRINDALGVAQEKDETNVYYEDPVTIVRTGRPGRPRKQIDPSFLASAVSPKKGLTKTSIARAIGVSVNTLTNRLDESHIDHKFPKVSDNELDAMVKKYHHAKLGSGGRYVTGHIRGSHGIKIPRYRVHQSLNRVSKVSRKLQATKVIKRRDYRVKRPNSLWHVDRHHKLILWGFVIHGFVDGFSQMIVALRTHTNNRAITVLRLLQIACKKHGLPSRIRADRGKENKAIAIYMIMKRGLNRGSFIWGSLEALHGLDRENPTHLWLLHKLFLGMIDTDCDDFVKEWNSHPISGEGQDKTPLGMRLMGMLNEGMYFPETVDPESSEPVIPDDCEEWSESEIREYYGREGRVQERQEHQTGAGFLDDEALDHVDFTVEEGRSDGEESDWEDTEADIDHQFIPSVKAPKSRNPFQGLRDLEPVFLQAFQDVRMKRILPEGYGVLREEWVNGEYPSFWMLKKSKRRRSGLICRTQFGAHVLRCGLKRLQSVYTWNRRKAFV